MQSSPPFDFSASLFVLLHNIYDLSAAAFHGTGLEPPGGPPPTAELRGLALTPDGTQLVVADFAAQNIYLLDPDNDAGTTVAVVGVTGFADSGPARVLPRARKILLSV
jgi:DNA-binding beta-propeller fold protein YncE